MVGKWRWRFDYVDYSLNNTKVKKCLTNSLTFAAG